MQNAHGGPVVATPCCGALHFTEKPPLSGEKAAPFPAALQGQVDAWSERSKPLFQLPADLSTDTAALTFDKLTGLCQKAKPAKNGI
ncbi:hypothetical protein Q8A73_016825 [Channa argus]|nr:hypothetical protein Q8A73_016825 [Channa argus]